MARSNAKALIGIGTKVTAEIVIVNKNAIALAADSAVTVGGERVWKTSNKIFPLGPQNDIAVMIWQSDEFVGFSWELIIKLFRKERCSGKFSTVKECADDLMRFLEDSRFIPGDEIIMSQLYVFVRIFEQIKQKIDGAKGVTRKERMRSACYSAINHYKTFERVDNECSFEEFISIYSERYIKPLLKDLFGRISREIRNILLELSYIIFTSRIYSGNHTGVVIMGYGQSELFPALYSYIVDGRDAHTTRLWSNSEFNSGIQKEEQKTRIFSFAQSDMAELFMEGMDNASRTFINIMLKRILDEKSSHIVNGFVHDADERTTELAKQRIENVEIVNDVMKELKKFAQEGVTAKILRVVRALPKEEMATMAQAIVEVTALRRKVDSPLESVGGPIDVAVISKGDGFIWIQRKHYFNIEMNRDFLYRKER